MTQKELHILIEKYSNGTASKEEIQLLESIISSAEKNVINNDLKNLERKAVKARILKNIKKKNRKPQFNQIFKIAASIILLIGISSFFIFQNINKVSNTLVYNDTGKPKIIYLPDSSKVTLNSKSELVYSDKFNEALREITLKGEAYFDVTSNKEKPFIVKTKGLSTKVLGTEFNIKESEETITVTVAEGLVRVSNSLDSLKLSPNQQIVFNSKSKQLQKKNVIAYHYNLWFHDEIDLNNLTLYEVAKILQNLYNTSIEFRDEKDKEVKMSISFNRNEDFDQILKRINFVNDVNLKKKGNEIEVQ